MSAVQPAQLTTLLKLVGWDSLTLSRNVYSKNKHWESFVLVQIGANLNKKLGQLSYYELGKVLLRIGAGITKN